MSARFYVGNDITDFSDNGKMRPVSRVTLEVDDDHIITAGDDSGLTLTAKCPYATQELVNKLLEQVKGYQYQAYTADAANIDPAAELGDGVTAGGVYGFISRVDDDGSGYPSLESPGEEELQDEFPAEGPMMQSINSQFTTTRASIKKNADAIELRVEKGGVVSAINQSAEEIKIDASKISLEGLVTVNQTFKIDEDGYLRCNGGTIGGFTIGSSALYNGLSSFSGTENGVYVGTDGISLGGGKFKVDAAGNLTASSGTFTGKVYANQIQVGGNAGYISGGQIGANTIGGGNIGGGTISGWNIGSATISGGNIGSDTVARGNLAEKYATSAQYNSLSADVANLKTIVSSFVGTSGIVANHATIGSLVLDGHSVIWKVGTGIGSYLGMA